MVRINSVFGVIFTEFGDCDVSAAVKTIEAKVTAGLQNAFKATQLSSFQISFYAFPDGWKGDGHQRPVDPTMYPDLFEVKEKKKLSLLTKRVMDVFGASVALLLLSPVFLMLGLCQADFEGACFLSSGACWPVRFALRIFQVPVHVSFPLTLPYIRNTSEISSRGRRIRRREKEAKRAFIKLRTIRA